MNIDGISVVTDKAFKQTIHFESVARKQKLFTCQCVVEMHSSPEALSLPRLD